MLTGYFTSDELHETLVDKQQLKTPQEKQQERIIASITPREMYLSVALMRAGGVHV